MLSLSARRAWIEIHAALLIHLGTPVALRKESVDRNPDVQPPNALVDVALRKESVDRNQELSPKVDRDKGRSPQGERG